MSKETVTGIKPDNERLVDVVSQAIIQSQALQKWPAEFQYKMGVTVILYLKAICKAYGGRLNDIRIVNKYKVINPNNDTGEYIIEEPFDKLKEELNKCNPKFKRNDTIKLAIATFTNAFNLLQTGCPDLEALTKRRSFIEASSGGTIPIVPIRRIVLAVPRALLEVNLAL